MSIGFSKFILKFFFTNSGGAAEIVFYTKNKSFVGRVILTKTVLWVFSKERCRRSFTIDAKLNIMQTMKNTLLAPSILSADFSKLGDEIKFVKENGGNWVHVDVMDGHFVPQVTYGQAVISSIRKCTDLPFDVHLMIEKPENSIPSYIESGADWVTFHIEATAHADLCVQMIHGAGKKAGIAICPSTPVSAIQHLLPMVDLVLVMTVNPGWGGQKLIPYTVEKVRSLADIKKTGNYQFLISVDGGVNSETLSSVVDAGADVVVSGSSFFRGTLGWQS